MTSVLPALFSKGRRRLSYVSVYLGSLLPGLAGLPHSPIYIVCVLYSKSAVLRWGVSNRGQWDTGEKEEKKQKKRCLVETFPPV